MSRQSLGLGYEFYDIFREGDKAFIELDDGPEEITKIGHCMNNVTWELYCACWIKEHHPCSESSFLISESTYSKLKRFVSDDDEVK